MSGGAGLDAVVPGPARGAPSASTITQSLSACAEFLQAGARLEIAEGLCCLEHPKFPLDCTIEPSLQQLGEMISSALWGSRKKMPDAPESNKQLHVCSSALAAAGPRT